MKLGSKRHITYNDTGLMCFLFEIYLTVCNLCFSSLKGLDHDKAKFVYHFFISQTLYISSIRAS